MCFAFYYLTKYCNKYIAYCILIEMEFQTLYNATSVDDRLKLLIIAYITDHVNTSKSNGIFSMHTLFRMKYNWRYKNLML